MGFTEKWDCNCCLPILMECNIRDSWSWMSPSGHHGWNIPAPSGGFSKKIGSYNGEICGFHGQGPRGQAWVPSPHNLPLFTGISWDPKDKTQWQVEKPHPFWTDLLGVRKPQVPLKDGKTARRLVEPRIPLRKISNIFWSMSQELKSKIVTVKDTDLWSVKSKSGSQNARHSQHSPIGNVHSPHLWCISTILLDYRTKK